MLTGCGEKRAETKIQEVDTQFEVSTTKPLLDGMGIAKSDADPSTLADEFRRLGYETSVTPNNLLVIGVNGSDINTLVGHHNRHVNINAKRQLDSGALEEISVAYVGHSLKKATFRQTYPYKGVKMGNLPKTVASSLGSTLANLVPTQLDGSSGNAHNTLYQDLYAASASVQQCGDVSVTTGTGVYQMKGSVARTGEICAINVVYEVDGANRDAIWKAERAIYDDLKTEYADEYGEPSCWLRGSISDECKYKPLSDAQFNSRKVVDEIEEEMKNPAIPNG